MPWGLTPVHLLIILIVVLIVLGPGKLPQTGEALGKAIRSFRTAVEGKDELTQESKAAIVEVRDELLRRPAPDITVTGHTDAIGSDRFNDQLSQLRAKRVKDELIRAGVRPATIALVARGSREPLYPNAAGKAEPRNRRVEITAR